MVKREHPDMCASVQEAVRDNGPDIGCWRLCCLLLASSGAAPTPVLALSSRAQTRC